MKKDKQMKQDTIPFFKEKKWIMAWWFKRQKNNQFSPTSMMELWKKKWGDDFASAEDKEFQDAFEWVRHTVQTLTMEQIKNKRYAVTYGYNKPIPKGLQDEAHRKGYELRKGSAKKHPLSLSGYSIYKKNGKKPIYGKKYELRIKQVNEFLQSKEDKKKHGTK